MIADVLTGNTPDLMIADLRARTKCDAMRQMACHAAKCTDLAEATISEALLNRDRLGTTAIGRGVALPHAVVGGLTKTFSMFARLRPPLKFDAIDGGPVFLVYLVLSAPDQAADGMHLLAAACRALRDPAVRDALDTAMDERSLRTVLDWALHKRPRI